MVDKISLAACSGMSPNGLITRVSCDDLSKSNENITSICMGSTSAKRDGYIQYVGKYPIIAVNGCKNQCVNQIMKQKNIDVSKTIIVKEILNLKGLKANDTSRLDDNGEECVSVVKKYLENMIKKNMK